MVTAASRRWRRLRAIARKRWRRVRVIARRWRRRSGVWLRRQRRLIVAQARRDRRQLERIARRRWKQAKREVGGWPRERRLAAAGGTLVVLSALIYGAYGLFKRPGDIFDPGAEFEAVREKAAGGGEVSWPVYGFDPARTRYLPARSELAPPFKKIWSFGTGSLHEFSPVIADGVLYGLNNSALAFAVDADSGKVKWRRKIGNLNASSPAYYKGTVYAVNLDPGRVVALDGETGKIRWSRDLDGRAESSPVVTGGRVYFGNEAGRLYALDADSGRTIWATRLGGEIKAAPALDEGTLYVGDYGGNMSAVRARDGRVKWSTSSQGSSFGRTGRFYSTPAVAYGRVYAGSLDGRVYSFLATSGRTAWSHSTGGYVYASPAVADTPHTSPTVYIGSYDRGFYALDARSGDERWRSGALGRISGAASVVGEIVYYSDFDSTTSVGLDVRSGKRLFRVNTGAYNPVISDGRRIYLTGYSSLRAFEPRG